LADLFFSLKFKEKQWQLKAATLLFVITKEKQREKPV
jgi:hypothetical protein